MTRYFSTDVNVRFLMAQARGLLLAVYASNPRELGEWGWQVAETTTTRTKATPKV